MPTIVDREGKVDSYGNSFYLLFMIFIDLRDLFTPKYRNTETI